jgi:hypothetical protein
MIAERNIMGTSRAIRNSSRFPVETDDELRSTSWAAEGGRSAEGRRNQIQAEASSRDADQPSAVWPARGGACRHHSVARMSRSSSETSVRSKRKRRSLLWRIAGKAMSGMRGHHGHSNSDDTAKVFWWKAPVKFKDPKPIIWTPNATYHFDSKSDLAVPVISSATRANIARQDGID